MAIPRVYLSPPLKANTKIIIPQDIAHRLQNVLRLRSGDELIVFNGQEERGGEFAARIEAIDKKQMLVNVLEWQTGIAESSLVIHLGQGIARGEKMDIIVQKAVELGVNFITPLVTEFCNVRLEGERLQQRLQHWQKVAVHASEQCGRCFVPQILPVQTLSQWMKTNNEVISSDYLRITLSPAAETSFDNLPFNINEKKKIALLVGPEGGISPQEMTDTLAHGFYACKIGPRILRTETAALVALSILQDRFGDLAA